MTLLDQVLDMDNLTRAWDAVADNAGISGADNTSIIRWRRNWEERLIHLSHAVRCRTYQPIKLRLRRIPKRRHPGTRTLRIPSVTDRVLQRAVSQVLLPFYESRFLDCSYGYRPHRGLKQAIQQIILLRENGLRYILNADIESFFDSVDHELLMRFLQFDLPDESLLPIISKWLEIGATSIQRTIGIPQGSPFSPLLANIYLHRFDLSMQANHISMVRYADDFTIFCKNQERAKDAQHIVANALGGLALKLEPTKTFVSSFDQGFEFLGVRFINNTYSYTWEDKKIRVEGDKVDWLFLKYGSGYE